MAQRHIERNERSSWQYVIAGLLTVGLVALIFSQPERDTVGGVAVDSAAGTVIDSAASAAASARARDVASRAVNDYLTFVDRNRARDVPDSTHAYTASGIRLVTDALSALAARDMVGGGSIGSQVVWLRARADTLYHDWRSRDQAEHARHARDAFLAVAALVQSLHERHFADIANEAIQVTDAARSVRPDVSLLEQRAAVQQFFDRAADAVRTMAEARD
jgi:hypothetical protein